MEHYKTLGAVYLDFKEIFDIMISSSNSGYFWHDNDEDPTFENGNWCNKEGEPIIDIMDFLDEINSKRKIPKNRKIVLCEDLKIVFENEFSKWGASNPDIFRINQLKIFQKKRDELKQFANQKSIYPFIELIENYIQFLSVEPEPVPIDSKGLSLPEIALICIYKDQHIDSTNADQILNRYNPKFKSGRKLIECYNKYQIPGDRIYLTQNETMDKNRAKLLQKVISYLELNEHETGKAKKEFEALTKQIDTNY